VKNGDEQCISKTVSKVAVTNKFEFGSSMQLTSTSRTILLLAKTSSRRLSLMCQPSKHSLKKSVTMAAVAYRIVSRGFCSPISKAFISKQIAICGSIGFSADTKRPSSHPHIQLLSGIALRICSFDAPPGRQQLCLKAISKVFNNKNTLKRISEVEVPSREAGSGASPTAS
jgi:hypothetical protein